MPTPQSFPQLRSAAAEHPSLCQLGDDAVRLRRFGYCEHHQLHHRCLSAVERDHAGAV